MTNFIPVSDLFRTPAMKPLPGSGYRPDAVNSSDVDAEGLAARLRQKIKGEVRFDDGSRALYSTDGSNYRQIPIGAVVPKDIEDVVETIALCREFEAPVLSRGGGTSLAGQCCNVAVVIDWSKYLNKVLEIDPARKLGRVQPGCVLDDLRDAAEQYTLTFGPDPSTHNRNTLGGMIGNDSCGVHSVLAAFEGDGARTADNIESLEILLYDGTRMTVGRTSEEELERIIRQGGRQGEIYGKLRDLRDKYADQIRTGYPHIPRRVSGYNLPYLLPENGFHVARALVGTEGTCVTILEATANLIYSPPARSLVVLGFKDVYIAGDHVPEVMAHRPSGLEGMDNNLVQDMKKVGLHPKDIKLLPDGEGWLLVEFGGKDKQESDDKARQLMDDLKQKPNPPSMILYDDPHIEREIWIVRESGLGATAQVPGEPVTWEGWEDSAVPPDKVGDYLRDLRKLFDKYDYECALYGHFGQGCIHTRIDFDFRTQAGIAHYRAFMEEAAHLVVRYGGSLSGEHGDGQSRAELLPIMFSKELIQAFNEFKSIWDPQWKMNPGKIVRPYKIDENLRLGAHYKPWEPKTHFQFADDHGSFAQAVLRCVGVGLCRRHNGGTMCPSYMVTREEADVTRGRSRLLFEMLQGQVILDGWRDKSVKDALDLCLACKGCKGECPIHVDMATYKAEFLSHYYAGRLRPRHAYAFGLIHVWARLANAIPGVTSLLNAVTQTPGLSALAKAAAGMDQHRRIPPFATQTFQQWFAARAVQNEGRPQAILWPDTFNNSFHVETAKAAVEVIESAGWQVVVPQRNMCCGRPLYDYGFLDTAKRWLRDILDSMRAEIQAGMPFVVLEPSCAAVFRDELINLLPNDEDAKRLHAQTFLLSDFLEQKVENYQPPLLKRPAIVHGHCHHKSILGMAPEEKVLEKMGIDKDVLDSGCCGMAGAFGFEEGDHYDIAIKCGERVLLPKVEAAAKDTLLIANGFSCREQISQCTDRHALHLAQVIQMALHQGPQGTPGPYPESQFITKTRPGPKVRAAILTGAALLAAALAWKLLRSPRKT